MRYSLVLIYTPYFRCKLHHICNNSCLITLPPTASFESEEEMIWGELQVQASKQERRYPGRDEDKRTMMMIVIINIKYSMYLSTILFLLSIKYLVYRLWHCIGNTFSHRFIPVFYILGYRGFYHMQCLTKIRVTDSI